MAQITFCYAGDGRTVCGSSSHWLVYGACLTLLIFISRQVELEQVTTQIEVPLLIFFISLFIVIGGVNVSVMWWALAMGGNDSHIGSTANIYIVTISERLASETGRPELAITPGMWFKKGTPIILVTLLICSLFIYFGYDFLYINH